ncbi:MAG: FAD-dependent oxidoreductase, partial [Actinobacteria bacterium]|nr:FAD-dependent oxidoreductase [Actinomycetota bacterium]
MVVGEVASPVDLLVIGGGPGGYAAALHAARLGRRVTLVERDALGGTCLNVGCIPSKALIEVADAAAAPRRVASWGVSATTEVDMAGVRDHLASVVADLTSGVASLLDRAGVRVLPGTAAFSRPNRVAVEHEGRLEHLEFRHAVVATGSRPVELPNLPIDGDRVVGSAELLFTRDLPDQLVLVGGGYVGVELACAFAKLGSHVTVVEMEDRVLPGFGKRIGTAVERGLRRLGVGLCLGHRAVGATAEGLAVTGPDGSLVLPADRIAVVVGRRPNSDTVRIADAGATVDGRGLVVVDAQRRATDRVFVIGDLTDGPALAHKATAEAEVAVDAACGRPAGFDPTCVPMIVFGDPQVLSVGLDRESAAAAGIATTSGRFPFAASGRARTLGDTEGYVEVFADE